jgi:hypothetical protein
MKCNGCTKLIGLETAALHAADLLEQEAQSIEECFTTDDNSWTEPETRDVYEDMMQTIRNIRNLCDNEAIES